MATAAVTSRIDRHYRFIGVRQKALGVFWSVFTWLLALLIFFPVFFMVLTAFNTEGKAYTTPPTFVFHPTFTEFSQVFSAGLRHPFLHSVFVTVVTLILVLGLGIPAAYALSIRAIGPRAAGATSADGTGDRSPLAGASGRRRNTGRNEDVMLPYRIV